MERECQVEQVLCLGCADVVVSLLFSPSFFFSVSVTYSEKERTLKKNKNYTITITVIITLCILHLRVLLQWRWFEGFTKFSHLLAMLVYYFITLFCFYRSSRRPHHLLSLVISILIFAVHSQKKGCRGFVTKYIFWHDDREKLLYWITRYMCHPYHHNHRPSHHHHKPSSINTCTKTFRHLCNTSC